MQLMELHHFLLQKDWPEIPSVEGPLHKELIPVPIYSMDVIQNQFLVNAPFSVSVFGDLEAKINRNMALLDNYASQIVCQAALDDDKHSSTRGKHC